MKKYTLLTIVLSLVLNVTTSMSAPVGSAFSYQGELVDNGSPANGSYDIIIEPFAVETGGTNLGQLAFTVTVENGLFTIPVVNFGDAIFDGEEIWLQLFTKPTADPTFTPLTPRQRLNAVPYAIQADFLAANGANNGNLLKFNGTDWLPASVELTPWKNNGDNIGYAQKVGVGVLSTTFGFQVKANGATDPVEITDSSGVGIMRIKDSGNVGIRTVNPQARLHVNGETGNSPFLIDIGGQQKLKVLENGALRVGLLTSVADTVVSNDGLYVHGNAKQFSGSHGLIKHAIHATCGLGAARLRYFNGSEQLGLASVSSVPGIGTVGDCIIAFPADINTSFFQATAATLSDGVDVGCQNWANNNELRCNVSKDGVSFEANIMVTIY